MGSAIFTFFVCTLGFYLWVRITKTLDLGPYLPYGIAILVVEVCKVPVPTIHTQPTPTQTLATPKQ